MTDGMDAPEPEFTRWKCPKCGNEDNLRVVALVTLRLDQDDEYDKGNFQTAPSDDAGEGDHEWGRNSIMICRACEHIGLAGQFEYTVPAPEPPTVRGSLYRGVFDIDEIPAGIRFVLADYDSVEEELAEEGERVTADDSGVSYVRRVFGS